MTDAERKAFVKAAKQATAGLDKSAVMLGILDDRNSPERWEFAMQVGHCLLTGKPLILVVPEGAMIPEKLHAAATIVARYRVGDLDSMKAATERALTAMAIERAH